jgi:hypothetical protein
MKRRALCPLRDERALTAFRAGLESAGFEIVQSITKPTPDDVLVIWNRRGYEIHLADGFERVGARVLVVENGWLGKGWRGKVWYSLCFNHHAGAGTWVEGDGSRWDGWGIELAPWRTEGEDKLILEQRGIGEPGIASPPRWAEMIKAKYGGRIRSHPGVSEPKISLLQDLEGVGQVFTWASAGALQALIAGVPVRCAFDRWIGISASSGLDGPLNRNDVKRLAMFRRLAWSMWNYDEVGSGMPLRRMLCETSDSRV